MQGRWSEMGVLVVLLGLTAGSFLNVAGWRISRGQSILVPSSHCVHCLHPLRPVELIPVFSYLFFKGHCRYCGGRIGWFYPVVEASVAGLFFYAYRQFGLSWEWLVACSFISLLAAITVSDLTTMTIPNVFTYTGIGLFAVLRLFVRPAGHAYWEYFSGFVIGGLTLFLIIWLSRGGMGGGDMKMLAMSGWVLGLPQTVLALFLSSLLGSIIGGLWLLWTHRGRKHPLPFAPFLSVGVLLSYFFGEEWLQTYQDVLFG